MAHDHSSSIVTRNDLGLLLSFKVFCTHDLQVNAWTNLRVIMTKSIQVGYGYCSWRRRVVAKFSFINWDLQIWQCFQVASEYFFSNIVGYPITSIGIVMQMSEVSFTFHVLPLSQSYIIIKTLTFIHEHRPSCESLSFYLLNKISNSLAPRCFREILVYPMNISFSRHRVYLIDFEVAIQLPTEFLETECVSTGPSLLAAPPRRNWNSMLTLSSLLGLILL
jgi:hypothetical protein